MKIANIHYPGSKENRQYSLLGLQYRMDYLTRYLSLSAEYGCGEEGQKLFGRFTEEMDRLTEEFDKLVNAQTDPDEPDDLESIRKLRPEGPRRLLKNVPVDYMERLRGSFYGRLAGCTLGAALEFQPVDAMEGWAAYFGDEYPLTDYWSRIKEPTQSHYITAKRTDLTKGHMDAAPPDDDIIYTLLGLLTMEQHGNDFTHEDMAEIWTKYLPLGSYKGKPSMPGCFWGELTMMMNLRDGVALPEAGVKGNPNLQNIAAWTRADSFGYAFPGWPEKAAELAYIDASINHRRNGVYGSMFMAATIAAAFAVDDPMEAVRIGLTEIPKDCLFAEGIRWALDNQGKYKNYREAADAVWAIYDGMFNGSALTNALHVVMGLDIGARDFTKTIGETVAMSGDNDCTGATAASIVGAVIGKKAVPANWTDPFNGRMHIYLNELPEYLDIEEVCGRFEALAKKNMQ